MKKRSIVAFLCACGFSLSCFSFPILAATVSTVTSEATLTFTPGTEPTTPVDPDDPSKPLDPPGQGAGAGWNVIAKATPFNDGTGDSLKGSTISLKGGYALSANTSATKPTPSNPVILTMDNAEATVFVASENSGLGTWIDRWYPTETPATTCRN